MEMAELAAKREAKDAVSQANRQNELATEVEDGGDMRKLRLERRSAGLCMICGEPSALAQCIPCTHKQREQRKQQTKNLEQPVEGQESAA